LSVVLCGCETLSVPLREREQVFENRVLRIFEPKREEVTEGWRKLKS